MAYEQNNNLAETIGQARPPKPIPLSVIPEQIPAELKALNQWVIWRYFYKPDLGYWDKPPLDANKSGNAAKSTDPKTWATFDKALSTSQLGNLDGIGIALTDKNGIVGFDLDDCRDPETSVIAEWALTIVQQLSTYWEISPSGTGLRGFGYGRKPGGRCRTGDFELYSHGRYLCITGHHLDGTPETLETVQEAIDTVYTAMFPAQERQYSSNGDSPHADDTAIVDALRHYKNGAKFCRLFDDGDTSDYQGDHSVADQGLCRLIAFRTQNPDQVDRLFRLSALNRHKWENREDYRDRTIARAITHVRDRYQSVSAETNGHPQDERNASANRDAPDQPSPKAFFRKKTFIPKRLADYLLTQHHIKYAAGILWVYENGVYVSGGERILAAAAQQLLGEERRQNRIEETLRYIEVATYAEMPHPDLCSINLLNGRLEWTTGTLQTHTPDVFTVIQLPIHYDAQATCPTFDRYLETTLDEDVIPLSDEIIGYLLTPDTRYEKAVMLTGDGENGKSVFIDTLTALLGSQHVSNVALQDLEENRFRAAELFGKLGNFFADLDPRALKSSSIFKTLVTGDEITAEHKHEDPFKFRNVARLVFSANKLPNSSDRTHAFYRRWHVIPFTRTFTEDTRDTELRAKLVCELPGILNRALRGLKRLSANKRFTVPQAVKEALSAYERQNDTLAAFLDEAVDKGPTFHVTKQRFYQCYRRWCDVYRLSPVSQTALSPRLYKLVPDLDEARLDLKGSRTNKGPWRWIGIQPIEDGPEDDEG